MCIAMNGLEEVEFRAPFRLGAFPAPGDLFFLAAFRDLAERRATPVPAPLFAPELPGFQEKRYFPVFI